MTKLVSIILPLYNTEKYIKETIHSVINQTNNRWELIIIDDGSKDSSPELVKPFLTNKNISYYYQQNSGVSIGGFLGHALCTGLAVAGGCGD